MSEEQTERPRPSDTFIADPPSDPDRLDEYAKWVQTMDKAKTRASGISGSWNVDSKDVDSSNSKKVFLQWIRAGKLALGLIPILWAIWSTKMTIETNFDQIHKDNAAILEKVEEIDTKEDVAKSLDSLEEILSGLEKQFDKSDAASVRSEAFRQKMEMFVWMSLMKDVQEGAVSEKKVEEYFEKLIDVQRELDEEQKKP